MEFFSFLWIGCILGTIAAVVMRGVSGWYVLLALLFGPLGLIIALVAAPKSMSPLNSVSISELKDEITNLKLNISNLQRRVSQLEHDSSDSSEVPFQLDSSTPSIEPDKAEVERTSSPEELVKPLKPEEVKEVAQTPIDHPISPEPIASTSIPQKKSTIIHKYDQPQKSSREPSKAEINFGQFWLNKIGIVIFTLGIGFFISYSFKYFPPLVKNLMGYLVSGVLFYLGNRFERQKQMKHYGLALMGAGWALTYFTTYALHHFDASRVIHNQFIDMILLFFVAIGMMWHSMRAKSETMMIVSLGTAYVTSLIGTVTAFTFVSSLVLGCVAMFLLYRFKWIKTLFLCIGMTYGIHEFFIYPSVGSFLFKSAGSAIHPLHNLYFLGAYWLLFFVGTHLVKGTHTVERNSLSVANFLNFILFFVMSGPVFHAHFHEYRVWALLGMGVFYLVAAVFGYLRDRKELYAGDIVIALASMTLATFLQYLPHTSLIIWMIQIPFILYIGLRFKESILQYAAVVFAGISAMRFGGMWIQDVSGLYVTSTMETCALVACASMGAAYYMIRQQKDVDELFGLFKNFFCGMAIVYANIYLWSKVPDAWKALALFVEVPVLLYLGHRSRDIVFKIAGQMLTFVGTIICIPILERKTFVDVLGISFSNTSATFLLSSVSMGAAYWINQWQSKSNEDEHFVRISGHAYSALAALSLSAWVCTVWEGVGLTSMLTLQALVFFALSKLIGLVRLRVYCHLLLLVVLARFVGLQDYHDLSGFKWVAILFQLVSMFGLYFVSRDNDSDDPLDTVEPNGLFIGFLGMLLWTIFDYAMWGWRSLILGVCGVALIVLGLSIEDKRARLGGFLVLGIGLIRIVLVDLAQLETIFKIISFIIVGALLLGLSFMYNRNFSGEQDQDK